MLTELIGVQHYGNGVVSEVKSDTGRQIDSQSQVGGWPQLGSAPAPADTDGDGIPDAWEGEHGLNPSDPSDARATARSGYSNLELYLNGLVPAPGSHPHAEKNTW